MYVPTTEDATTSIPAPWQDRLGASQPILMKPAMVRVSPRRREALLRKAGWVRQDVQLLIKDFKAEGLTTGYACFLQFGGPRGESHTARADVQSGGIATFPRFALKPNGTIRLIVVSTSGTKPLLQGTAAVPARLGQYLVFDVVQDHEDVQVRAENQQKLSEQLQTMGNIGIKVLGVEAGGKVTSSAGTERTTTGEVTYRVRIGLPNLTVTLRRRG